MGAPRVVLVNPPGDILIDEHLEPPLGLLSIASYVSQELQLRPVIFDLTKYDVEVARSVLLAEPADIYGFTVYCTKWLIVKDLIADLREEQSRALIIVGGPNPTAMPHETLAFGPIDIVVCGEGEKAFCQLVRDYVQGMLSPESRTIIYGERLAESEFPVLDYSFVEPPELYSRRCFGKPVVVLEASRGCLSRCIFCNSIVSRQGRPKGIVGKAPDKVIQEIVRAMRLGYEVFRFNDDSFTYAAYANGLVNRLAGLDIKYRAFANARHLSGDVLRALKDSGCFHLAVGIESYNPDNLRILGKNTTQTDIREGINLAADLGIMVRAYFIVGLPFDTHENIRFYMRLVAQEVAFSEYTVYPLIPYPGSQIWSRPERYGYTLTDRNFDRYMQIGKGGRTAFALRHKNFSESDIAVWLQATNAIFAKTNKVQTLQSGVL